MEIKKGERLKLSAIQPGKPALEVGLACTGATIDFACFGLDAQGKLSDERYMTFFNQPVTPCGGVRLEAPAGDAAGFKLDLDKLPASIQRLVLTAAIDGSGTMKLISNGYVRLLDSGKENARFSFSGADFDSERALMLAEFYRKDGEWRFSATAQGFNGGLDALIVHFGGDVATPSPAPSPTPAPTPAPPPPPAPPKVSLSKVTLEKRGDKILLEKRGNQQFGRISINLNWNRGTAPAKKGFFSGLGGGNKGIDLDLGCMYEHNNGGKGVIQALGNNFGNFDYDPFVKLEGDDRTGTSTTGENMHINGTHFDAFRRILVYAFIYEGVPNWAATDGVVTIEVPNQAPVEVRMDSAGNEGMCAVAMLENVRGELQVTKLVQYFRGHELMDRNFGFGFEWRAASK